MAKKTKKQRQVRRVFPPLPLKAWWKLADVTQREVAEVIGVDETTLSLIGSGGRDYMRHHLEDIAKFLSEKLGRKITPSMLLHPPGAKLLAEVVGRIPPNEHERAAKVLEAAFPEASLT